LREALFHEFHFMPRRRNAPFGLLLENMQNVNGLWEPHGIDGSDREQTNITELKTEKGLPLGLMNSEYSEIGLTLQTGDRVLMYTDGAVEAANGGGEEYGTSRLVKSLQKPGVSARSVLTEVQEFASGGTLSDDATAIVLRRE
jgi:serine phosphatase RsbU (regulator of sigma subunit)